jgi:uncharacterized membrane protein YbaN (DUF454 family)
MTQLSRNNRPVHFFQWGLCIAAIVVCLLLGVVGLVLPIIPGLLFLFIAAVLLTRVSSRFANAMEQHHGFSKSMRFVRSAQHLSIGEQIKLSGLVLVKSVISGIDAGFRALRKSAQ